MTSLANRRPGRVRTTRSPCRSKKPAPASSSMHATTRERSAFRAESLIPDSSDPGNVTPDRSIPDDVRRARRSASSARSAAPRVSAPASVDSDGVDRRDVALGRADVPPAPPARVAVRRAADGGVVALAPIEEVVATLVARARPVRDLVPAHAGGVQTVVGQLVLLGLVVVVGRGAFAGGDHLAERRARLHGERVRAHVGGPECERGVEGGLPVGDALAGRAVDQIQVDALDAGVAGPADRPLDVRRVVGAAERGEHVRPHRLHAERQAVHAGGRVVGKLARVDGVGVALDGDLGARRTRGWRRGSR